MNFTVAWRRSAEDKLVDIWIQADDRHAVTAAAIQIDRELGDCPETKGEEFYGDRLLVVFPLQLVFAVLPEVSRVEVVDIWHA